MTSSDRYDELLKCIANEEQKSSKSNTTSTFNSDKIKDMRSQEIVRGRMVAYCRRPCKLPKADELSRTEIISNFDKKSSQSNKNDSPNLDDT